MSTAATRTWPGHLEAGLNDESDRELVKRAKRGSAEAFSALVQRHQHIVYNLAYRYMRDSNSAEDMAQEAFLKGFRLLKGFRGDCSFSTWMYRVTSSVCLTEIARRKKRGEVLHTRALGTRNGHSVRRSVNRRTGRVHDHFGSAFLERNFTKRAHRWK